MNQQGGKFIPWKWSRTDIIAAISTTAAIIITFFNYELWTESRDAVAAANKQAEFAEKTYEANARALIVPKEARIIGHFTSGKPLIIEIAYHNAGHDPAIISSDNQAYAMAGFAKTAPGGAGDIPKIENKTCLPAASGQHGLVVYPHFYREYTSRIKIPAASLSRSVFDGSSMLYIMGCFTYQTLHTVHHTGYCFYLRSAIEDDNVNSRFLFCGHGNFSD